MAHRVTLLLPGVGSYRPGVLSGLGHLPEVRSTIDAVDHADRGRHRVPRLLLDLTAPDERHLSVHDPTAGHLAVYTTAVAVAALLHRRFGVRAHTVVGHSAGEIAALAAAGAVDVGDGARMILARDAALAETAPPPGGLVVLEASAADVARLLAGTDLPSLQLACDNAPNQCVVSGPARELAALAASADRSGHRTTWLTTATAFHNRLLADAARAFRDRTSSITVRPPGTRVFSAVLVRPYRNTGELRDAAGHHLVRPVHFRRALTRLHRTGTGVFLETGPRNTLTALARATVPGVRAACVLPRSATEDHLAAVIGATLGPGADFR
ncbi:acyltransferase domain-containing protein [Actinosynnema sp. NPDC023587]|uniref:ACP S-malonyltransferase n=1 Tax=Actinosynnema sp. NPDC023587 TaxID=3154695 RepID=UPI00340FBBAA